jgi:hypothetical protein
VAKFTNDLDGSVTIIMSNGLQLRIPGFTSAPSVDAQDVRNVTTAMLALVDNLDERLAAIEKAKK